ncbi:MAG TPA: ATPase domain-containing protein [Armatimonadota bacterium]|nr:ATPase domain-containing protein [Armatimonadota bacterium]
MDVDGASDQSNGQSRLVATGIEGLDNILCGGLTPDRVYLVEGDPGAGKTTLALKFLLEGARRGEPVLYVTLSETKAELTAVARSHGWTLDAVNILELIASEESLEQDSQLTMFHTSEVELSETTRAVLAEVERTRPTRVVFDSLSEMRLLAQNPLRYRRQILALKQFFIGRHCTVLLLDDRTSDVADLQLQSIAHGVIMLQQLAPEYGAERRRLRVVKLRGVKYRGGFHDFNIERGGLNVFPRLVASEHRRVYTRDRVESGVPALDALLGGGLDRGTSTLLIGPAGSGKSTVASQYAVAAAQRGERAAIFSFDESLDTLRARSTALGMPLQEQMDEGRMIVQQIDPAELSPGEFTDVVRRAVEPEHGDGAKVVVIDSLNGYLNAMPEERFLIVQLHELLTYLGQQGVVTILIMAQHGLVGSSMQTPVDASYLADGVVMLRYFEAAGHVRKAISVMKKRSGAHEDTIRELRITDQGIQLGDPLKQFQGILTGVPSFLVEPGLLQ